MIIGSIIGIATLLTVAVALFINQPSFGRTPRGERLERVKQSPNYRNGAFQNLHETTLMTSDRGRFEGILDFLFRKIEGLRPEQPVKAVKTDLRKIGKDEEVLVWFG
ncbi:MBL fold metallo-hydrolase, partial [Bacteroides thetaiotaomicron]